MISPVISPVMVLVISREQELLERWQTAERASAAAERVAIAAELAAGAAERVAAGAEVRAEAALRSLRTAHDVYHTYLAGKNVARKR